MRRIPIVPTIVVALCVAVMIALGFWQLLDRLPQKEAFLAQLAANPARPPIAFPRGTDATLLFRHTSGVCTPPTKLKLAGAGASGFRLIATCADGMIVQLGTTHDPMARVAWGGGAVSGYVSHAPDSRSLIGSLVDRRPQRLMLVADTPPAGLSVNARPDLNAVPNNHLAYAWQWFFFAAVASVIYGIAVRRRMR